MDKFLIKKDKRIVDSDDDEPTSKKSKKAKGDVKDEKDNDCVKQEKVDKNDMFVGAHLSIAGGMYKAVEEAVRINAKSFAMFLCNQKTWNNKPLEEKDAEKFRSTCQKHNFASHLMIPHGSYLMNCGSPDKETLTKSRNLLVDGLKRCEMLDIYGYNFHPGSTCGKISVKDCLDKIAESINHAHSLTNNTVAVLENMSKQGNTVGGDFNQLKEIINKVKDKSRVGVCLDTCHAFAAGYNLADKKGYQKMMNDFDTIIGFEYLKAIHLNDSKGPVDSHLDRHENIGKGKIGIKCFELVMNEPHFKNIPIVLETPFTEGIYEKEIKLLYTLVK